MIKALPKKKILAGIISAVFMFAFFTPIAGLESKAMAAAPLIVIDPGHNYNKGAVDSGAIGIDGTKEATLTMQLAPKVIKELQNRGYRVMTTLPVVDGVKSIMTPPNITTWGRAKASNDVSADLFLSLHYNQDSSSSTQGSLVLYDSRQLVLDTPTRQLIGPQAGANPALAASVQPKSLKLATALRDKFYAISEFDMKGNRATGLQNQGADVYTYNNAPAVTIEVGFLTNSTDLANSKDGNKQLRVSKAIGEAVEEFFGGSPGADSTPPTVGSLSLGATSPTVKADFTLRAKNVADDNSGVNRVLFRVISPGGEEKKYTATDEKDGNWRATFKLAHFGNKSGVYKIIAYAYDNAGNYTKTSTKRIEILDDKVKPTIGSVTLDQPTPTVASSFKIRAKGVADDSGISTVKFQFWPDKDTSKLKTVVATQNGSDWEVMFNPEDFGRQPGRYYVKAIAYDKRGNNASNTVFMDVTAAPTKDVAKPTMGALSLGGGSPTTETRFTIAAKDVTDPSGVKDVKFRIANQSTSLSKAKSITAVDNGNGQWQATFDIKDFGGYYGTYKVNVYGTDALGNTGVMKTGEFTVKTYLSQTPIMGSPQATVDQMVNYFMSNANGYQYPTYYMEAPISTTLRQFAQMYYDVAMAEGVRPEVAWVQMCLETKYLQFGGDVKIGQFNFAGLGATGGGEPGYDFSKVYGNNAEGLKYGIIGHVQHLKCYASKDDVFFKNGGKPIDPRWDAAVKAGYRGIVTYVEDLENNWAATPAYSKYMYDGLARLMSQPSTAMAEVMDEGLLVLEPEGLVAVEEPSENPGEKPEATEPPVPDGELDKPENGGGESNGDMPEPPAGDEPAAQLGDTRE